MTDKAEPLFPVAAGFVDRHCGIDEKAEREMLAAIGVESLEDLGRRAIPESIFVESAPDIGAPLSEIDALNHLRAFAEANQKGVNMIGMGYYGTRMPSVVIRRVLENPGFYTAYTPYQAEIAQGRLEMLLNFQTMIADLTALPIANSSLLDEATAAAEAMALLYRAGRAKSKRFLVDENLFPQTLAVIETRARHLGWEIAVAKPGEWENLGDAFGAIIGYPGGDGATRDWREVVARLRENKIPAIAATDLLALTLLAPPGEMGFAAAIGSSQRFGIPPGFGGPHAGFLAVAAEHQRAMPGRIVGVSRDADGRPGLRLALQTREQHIRREKATSNICTAQVLPAILSVAFAIYHGPGGLRRIATRAARFASTLAAGLEQMGYTPRHGECFDTLRIDGVKADIIAARAWNDSRVNLLRESATTIGISVDQLTLPAHARAVWRAFAIDGKTPPDFDRVAASAAPTKIPTALRRKSPFLSHPVFNEHHTEHAMLRYLRRLASRDISLDRSMIPLGSCTMKLNAATEMIPLSWTQLADIHPLAPPTQTAGYQALIDDFCRLLREVSGFDAVSLQPNAGAQGEYAGLLCIRAYHRARGEEKRDICLIPETAHGTNPASAAMAGMRVVALKGTPDGSIDIDDLRQKIADSGDSLAALMVTYPSTCGTFGANIVEVCRLVRDAGGQVYMDGANFNALVGVSLPGRFGPDVMHINLHKTFCIPHGGGGPGMGPIAVREHLRAFLPGHPFTDGDFRASGDVVSAAPFGSALILCISWLYMRMMGGAGLRRATLLAILAANYVARKVDPMLPVVYWGEGGFVAHECVVDSRGFQKTAGIGVEDIAKRLMDFGFHAPTVSWPLAGAMMIEPTESESKAEIDRFCEALSLIRAEIAKIESGEWPQGDNPIANAPHPARRLLAAEWNAPYSREEAAYPAEWIRADKYWPPTARIDQVFGDRRLVCARDADGGF